MPKKFGTNTKAAEAKAIKDSKKIAEENARQIQKENEYWKDEDKHINNKLQRKDEKEAKRLEQLQKKKELQKLHEEEMAAAQPSGPPKSLKVTHAEIHEIRERNALLAARKEQPNSKVVVPEDLLLVENTNRLEVEGEEARTIEEAITALSTGDDGPGDHHVERRLKAAYKAFEEKMMPILKAENSGMRHGQLKHLCFKQFQSSPDNPKNQSHTAYNTKP